MRVVLLPVTCDHPGQCATGKLLNEGKAGCMRCHLVGVQSKNTNNHHMYNGNNRYHVRYPTAKRKLTEEVNIMYQIKDEDLHSQDLLVCH